MKVEQQPTREQMMHRILNRVVPFAIAMLLASFVRADDPFLITAQSTTGTPKTVIVSGSSIVDLVRNAIKNESQFATLANQGVSANLRYGGINSAIQFSKNASNTSTTVSIPSIHFTRTFTGANASDVEKQIENFAKKNGANIYGDFLRHINEHSTLGVTDGNPLATTALLADYSYTLFGLQPAPFAFEDPMDRLDATAEPRWRFDSWGGVSHTDSGDGYFAGGAFTLAFRFGDRVGLSLATPFTYRNVDGASIFDVGEEVSLPILAIKPKGDRTLSWLITPTFIAGAGGSIDAASGGIFMGGGATSSLSYQLSTFTFTLANQLDYFHGVPIQIGDYKFDTNLNQEVLKNGLKVTKIFGRTLFVDASITRSDFLQRAAIDHYWTPGAGAGIRLGDNAGLRIGYVGDFARRFNVNGGDIQLYLNY
jgi:hypothetical protein